MLEAVEQAGGGGSGIYILTKKDGRVLKGTVEVYRK